MLRVKMQLLNIMRNMVSSVTGLQRSRQLHEVLHSGHGDLTLLIKEKVYLLHPCSLFVYKWEGIKNVLYRVQILHFY
jgi:hypothetical protein